MRTPAGIFLLCLMACTGGQKKSTDSSLGAAAFLNQIKNPDHQLVDVRTLEELRAGFLPGSLHLDIKNPSFEKAIGLLDSSKTYLVFCASGIRSGRAAEAMKARGLTVLTLHGGLGAGGITTTPELSLPEGLSPSRAPEATDSQPGVFVFTLSNGDRFADIQCQTRSDDLCQRFEVKFSGSPATDSTFFNLIEAQNYVVSQYASNPILP
jgi:rhodanese-related sulfurtransferase